MKKPLTVGIVGFGYWGPNLVRNFRSIPDCRLKVVCDLSEQRLKQMRSLYPEVTGESDFAKLINDEEIDAIVVATSARLHFPMAKAALEAGKHVLIEKPMACATSECEELIALAKQRSLIVMVGHTFLYSAAVRKIKEIVDNRDLGDLRYIAARRLNLPALLSAQRDRRVDLRGAPRRNEIGRRRGRERERDRAGPGHRIERAHAIQS